MIDYERPKSRRLNPVKATQLQTVPSEAKGLSAYRATSLTAGLPNVLTVKNNDF